MAQVFRKAVLVRTLEIGSQISKSHGLNCVTLQGDIVSEKGALTGGYLDLRRSRIQAHRDTIKLGEQATAYAKQQDLLTQKLEQVDQ
eukprot:4568939-Prymnesium_polylepis.1